MSHSFVSSECHCVFSTKERRPTFSQDMHERAFAYLGGIAHQNGIQLLAAGGTENHLHLLLSLPATISLAKAIQLLKGGSSKWIHDSFQEALGFAWQEGYGAFSIGISQREKTIRYIRNQRKHHLRTTFEEEFMAFLIRHGFKADSSVWI